MLYAKKVKASINKFKYVGTKLLSNKKTLKITEHVRMRFRNRFLQNPRPLGKGLARSGITSRLTCSS